MQSHSHPVVRIGILGCGTVGGALIRLIETDADRIAARTGVRLEVARVAVRNLSAERDVNLPPDSFTRDPASVVNSPDIHLVVETIGGIEPARQLVIDSLKSGKPVVTANKELVANVGQELFEAASAGGVDLFFEAAVGGGIPLIRVLRESLAGERITRVMGIVNGTTNFILTKMTEEGAEYADVLAEAQQLGFAEADPTADVEGSDAAAKAAILATIAFGAKVVGGDVYQEGISRISPSDIAAASHMGHVIKLLAVAECDSEEVAVRVHPTMVPEHHPLASVRDSFNAVFLEGSEVGDLMLYGRGAGGGPTASAILGDVISAARNLQQGVSNDVGVLAELAIRPIDETASAFYLQLDVEDKPGVLAVVASVFGHHGVSIRSMEQRGQGTTAHLVFITHQAREADVQATLRDLRDLNEVKDIGALIRVIGD
ncbi:MAG: homoserine dehydrogenase [Actinomycetota bacterium]|nr:homoserine dehydrogenase [Actinomycetota bacterium]MEC9270547.1 homoserine dehydrogenase [Actinomycetota bacterium]MEC9316750.1 homoserine dehydrogenase [Actinomycetota bacterium]MED5173038.1 homoserine dehydrogenase [Actinomycetota bacterium]